MIEVLPGLRAPSAVGKNAYASRAASVGSRSANGSTAVPANSAHGAAHLSISSTPRHRPKSASHGQSIPKRIGFLGFDGMTSLDLTGPLEAFAVARAEGEQHVSRRCYETLVVGVANRTFVAASGATFKAHCTIRRAPEFDTIVVPGGSGLRDRETAAAIADWLRHRMQSTRRIVSVCGGIYAVAGAGLLDGRSVTTHWRHAAEIVRRFPRLKLKTAAPFLIDPPFYSCGGGTAGLELSVAMIEEDFGVATALAVAREFGLSLHRAPARRGAPRPDEQADVEARLADLPGWITSRLAEDLSVEVLAEKACLCPRHFRRVFKRAFKSTPAEFVELLRINEAERRLATERASIESVAASVGFKTAEMFRRAFERRVGQTPKRFQRELRLNAQMQTGGMRVSADVTEFAP